METDGMVFPRRLLWPEFLGVEPRYGTYGSKEAGACPAGRACHQVGFAYHAAAVSGRGNVDSMARETGCFTLTLCCMEACGATALLLGLVRVGLAKEYTPHRVVLVRDGNHEPHSLSMESATSRPRPTKHLMGIYNSTARTNVFSVLSSRSHQCRGVLQADIRVWIPQDVKQELHEFIRVGVDQRQMALPRAVTRGRGRHQVRSRRLRQGGDPSRVQCLSGKYRKIPLRTNMRYAKRSSHIGRYSVDAQTSPPVNPQRARR